MRGILFGFIALALIATACGGDDDGADSPLAQAIADEIQGGGGGFDTREDAECFAGKVVSAIGEDRMADLGVTVDNVPELEELSLNDGEIDSVVDAMDDCLDLDAYRKQEHADSENAPPGTYRGLKRIQFTGGFWGMTAAMARFPEQRFTAICLSNNDSLSPFRKVEEIADLYLSNQMDPLPEIDPDAGIDAGQLPREQLAALSGTYRINDRTIWQILVDDEGQVRLQDHDTCLLEVALVGVKLHERPAAALGPLGQRQVPTDAGVFGGQPDQ